MQLSNLFGRSKWKKDFTAGEEAYKAGDLSKAEQLWTAALDKAEKLGDRDPAVADTAYQLARLYYEQRRISAADAMDRRAFSIRLDVLGPEDPLTIQSYVAILERATAQPEMSNEKLLRSALEQCQERYGENSWQHAKLLGSLAAVLESDHEFSATMGKAFGICQWILGPGRSTLGKAPDVARFLGRVCMDRGHYGEATRFFEGSLRYNQELKGAESLDAAEALFEYGGALEGTGQYEEAEKHLRRALQLQELRAPGGPGVAMNSGVLARVLRARGRLQEAAPLYRRYWEYLRGAADAPVVDKAECELGLMEAALETGDEEAGRHRFGALVNLIGKLPPERQLDISERLRQCSLRLERAWAEKVAEPMLQLCLQIRERVLGKDHPATAIVLCDMARNAQQAGFHGKVDGYLEQARAGGEAPEVLLEAATVFLLRGDSRTARGLAAKAVEMLDGRPEEQARAIYRVAEIDLSTGNLNAAYHSAEQARNALPQCAERALAGLVQARVRGLLGQWEQARKDFEAALAELEKVPADPADLARARRDLASTYELEDQYVLAFKKLQEAREVLEPFPRHPERALITATAARLALKRGRPDEARTLVNEAAQFLDRVARRDDERRLAVVQLIGPVLIEAGNVDAGIRVCEEGLELIGRKTRILYPDGEASCPILCALADGYLAQGRVDASQSHAMRALKKVNQVFGEGHPAGVPCVGRLARALAFSGKTKEAIATWQVALQVVHSTVGPQHSLAGWSVEGLAETFMLAGEYNQAEDLAMEARKIRRTPFGDELMKRIKLRKSGVAEEVMAPPRPELAPPEKAAPPRAAAPPKAVKLAEASPPVVAEPLEPFAVQPPAVAAPAASAVKPPAVAAAAEPSAVKPPAVAEAAEPSAVKPPAVAEAAEPSAVKPPA
ncbi:MAG: tetratricopeptide repeat protein, partial [Armatimonadetes bacterium]|nr:tetratricopeptide repeat protein [Armatimonadota bacterium]